MAMRGSTWRDASREKPEVVVATSSRLVAPALMKSLRDYDTVTVVMTTASNKQAVVTNSREAVYGYDQRVETFGSKGMAVSENRRPNPMVLSARGSAITRRPCFTSSSSATAKPSTEKSTQSSRPSKRVGLRLSVSKTDGAR